MILVMVVHSDFFSLGAPDISDLQSKPVASVSRIIIQALSIPCVNIFILISGFFGIRPKRISLASFIYQILFYFVLAYATCMCLGIARLSIIGVLQCFCLTPSNWFVKSYLLLFILTPVLNAFVNLGNRKLHLTVLTGFFVIQTIYGCIGAMPQFEKGYSTLSFIGLYLLGRYLSIYQPRVSSFGIRTYIAIYLGCTLLLTTGAIGLMKLNKNYDALMFNYINPLVILEACALLLVFSKIKFQSKAINFVAASSFAVYLLHANPYVLNGIFKETVETLYNLTSGIATLFSIGIFIVIVFVVSVSVDQLRKKSYEFFLKEICNRRMESRHL